MAFGELVEVNPAPLVEISQDGEDTLYLRFRRSSAGTRGGAPALSLWRDRSRGARVGCCRGDGPGEGCLAFCDLTCPRMPPYCAGAKASSHVRAQCRSARSRKLRNGGRRPCFANARSPVSSPLANQLARKRKTLLLFDEMEDLFEWHHDLFSSGPPRAASRDSKLGLVEQLESNPIPTIWISNRVAGIDPALLRRFGFAVEFRQPSSRRRAEILLKHFANDVALSHTDAESITSQYDTSPAQLASAVRAA